MMPPHLSDPRSGPRSGPCLSACHIAKHYGAVRALVDGSISLYPGEIVALLGANGSGKSTLGKVMTGITGADAGALELGGNDDKGAVSFASPSEARRRGVTAVYQELSLVPDLSVAENIWLGHEPMRLGGLDRRAMRTHTEGLLEHFADVFAVTVRADTAVLELPPSERQLVEILKALSQRPRVLILDEATASLDNRQVERLFTLMRQWRAEGMSLAFISHRMDEIFRIADRAIVLCNGATVGERCVAKTDEAELVALMTGATTDIPELKEATPATVQQPIHKPVQQEVSLSVHGLKTRRVQGLSFSLHQGELLGLGGLQGQGQEEVLLALFGALPHSGEVFLGDRTASYRTPRQAMQAGVAYVPGDRGGEGLLPVRPILDNLQLPNWPRYGLPLRMNRAERDAQAAARHLTIRFTALRDPVTTLSGGNAQKVVIAKWLLRNPHILLLNDPTKGIDVGAKAEFYTLLSRLRQQGSAILLYSSDDDELATLCQRVLVMHHGQLTAELEGHKLTRSALVAASLTPHSTPETHPMAPHVLETHDAR